MTLVEFLTRIDAAVQKGMRRAKAGAFVTVNIPTSKGVKSVRIQRRQIAKLSSRAERHSFLFTLLKREGILEVKPVEQQPAPA